MGWLARLAAWDPTVTPTSKSRRQVAIAVWWLSAMGGMLSGVLLLPRPWSILGITWAGAHFAVTGIAAIILQTTDHWLTATLAFESRFLRRQFFAHGSQAVLAGLAWVVIGSTLIAISLIGFIRVTSR